MAIKTWEYHKLEIDEKFLEKNHEFCTICKLCHVCMKFAGKICIVLKTKKVTKGKSYSEIHSEEEMYQTDSDSSGVAF